MDNNNQLNNQLNSSLNRPFGYNILPTSRTISEITNIETQEFENNIINPFTNFWSRNYNLSQQEITNELRKAQSQIYTLGQVIKEGQIGRGLNMKF